MKTKEELNALKEEVVTLYEKLHELTDKELEQVTGGGTLLLIDGMNSHGLVQAGFGPDNDDPEVNYK